MDVKTMFSIFQDRQLNHSIDRRQRWYQKHSFYKGQNRRVSIKTFITGTHDITIV